MESIHNNNNNNNNKGIKTMKKQAFNKAKQAIRLAKLKVNEDIRLIKEAEEKLEKLAQKVLDAPEEEELEKMEVRLTEYIATALEKTGKMFFRLMEYRGAKNAIFQEWILEILKDIDLNRIKDQVRRNNEMN